MGYIIYSLTAPSHEVYIGMTGTSIERRWAAHKRRAFVDQYESPLYEAIRIYGADAFTISELETAVDKPEAQKKEKFWIKKFRDLGVGLYNQSDGGETDAKFGSIAAWERINATSETREAYLRKLSEVKKANDWTDYEALSEAQREWRKENPRLAYKQARRALRLATRASRSASHGPVFQTEEAKHKMSESHKRYWAEAPASVRLRKTIASREAATKQWAKRTDEEKEALSKAISETHRERYRQNPEIRKQVSAQLQEARKNVDREKQGKAASKGLKEWWAKLRADPEAYKAHIARRAATLRKTNESKNV